MLAGHVARQARLRRGQVVREDVCIAHELAVLVNHHGNSAARVFCQISDLLVLPREDVNLLEVVLDARDLQQGDNRARVTVEVVPVDLDLLRLYKPYSNLTRPGTVHTVLSALLLTADSHRRVLSCLSCVSEYLNKLRRGKI